MILTDQGKLQIKILILDKIETLTRKTIEESDCSKEAFSLLIEARMGEIAKRRARMQLCPSQISKLSKDPKKDLKLLRGL